MGTRSPHCVVCSASYIARSLQIHTNTHTDVWYLRFGAVLTVGQKVGCGGTLAIWRLCERSKSPQSRSRSQSPLRVTKCITTNTVLVVMHFVMDNGDRDLELDWGDRERAQSRPIARTPSHPTFCPTSGTAPNRPYHGLLPVQPWCAGGGRVDLVAAGG